MITALLDAQERKHQIFLRQQEEKMEKRQEKYPIGPERARKKLQEEKEKSIRQRHY